MNPIRYHEAAEVELLSQVGYFDLRVRGLGRRLLNEVRRAESLIAQFPNAGKEIRPGVRKRVLRKFKYSLIYSLEKEGPLIIALAHHSRRPEYWLGRTLD